MTSGNFLSASLQKTLWTRIRWPITAFLFVRSKSLTPTLFANQNTAHCLVTFRATVFLTWRLRLGREADVATRTMAARFFLGFAFCIALAARICGVIHFDWTLLAPPAVALRLLLAEFFSLFRRPIFLISQPASPSFCSLDAFPRTISAQVMLRLETRLAPFEQAGSGRKLPPCILRGRLRLCIVKVDQGERQLPERQVSLPSTNSAVRRFLKPQQPSATETISHRSSSSPPIPPSSPGSHNQPPRQTGSI